MPEKRSPEIARAISVRQPWASFIVTGDKWCENRTWPTDYRGPLWIHAAATVDLEGCEGLEFEHEELPRGALVGCVDLVDVLTIADLEERWPELVERHCLPAVSRSFIEGPWCWILTRPRYLANPLSRPGQLRVWRFLLPDGLLNQLEPGRRSLEGLDTLIIQVKSGGSSENVAMTSVDGRVWMEFRARGAVRIAQGRKTPAFVTGEPWFQAACRRAWREFPELFSQSEGTRRRRSKAARKRS
jgi:hypothetical protein